MKNLALATQNGSADSAGQDSGLREDSARLRKCWPGHTEQKRGLCGLGLRTPRGLREAPKVLAWPHSLGLRTPRGLREAPKVLAWPHRMEARTPRGVREAPKVLAWPHRMEARTPRGLGLRTLREAPKALAWLHRTEARTPRGLGLRTPPGLREAPKVLAWPHRTEARTPRGLGLRTLREDSRTPAHRRPRQSVLYGDVGARSAAADVRSRLDSRRLLQLGRGGV